VSRKKDTQDYVDAWPASGLFFDSGHGSTYNHQTEMILEGSRFREQMKL